MILDLIVILIFLSFVYIGYKVGFIRTLLKFASALSGIIVALCLTKPTTNLVIKWGLSDGVYDRALENVISSEAFEAYIAGGEGEAGASYLLEELGIPSYIAGFVGPKVADAINPYEVASAIAEGVRYVTVFVVTFIFLLIFSSLIFFILKKVFTGIRNKIGFIKFVDGILGVIFYILLFLLFIYTLFLILSIILQSSSSDSGFIKFISNQLHLEDDKFGVAKYLFENNIIGNFMKLLF